MTREQYQEALNLLESMKTAQNSRTVTGLQDELLQKAASDGWVVIKFIREYLVRSADIHTSREERPPPGSGGL